MCDSTAMRAPQTRCLIDRVVLTRALLMGFAALCLAALSGCSRSDALGVAGPDRPSVLRIGWMPNDEEPERRVRLDILARFLAERLRMPVKLVQTGQYSAQIEALRAGKIEVGSMGPFAYVVGRDKARIEPLIVPGQASGQHNTYRSAFIVPRDSPLHSIADVKAHGAGLTLAWVNPASASGHLVPRACLEEAGLDPENDFKHVVFTLSHLSSVMTVKGGKVDLAATSTNSLQRLIDKGRIGLDDVRVIWRSEPIVTSVTVVSTDLSAAFRQELREAYLAFCRDRPEDWARFTVNFTVPDTIWVPAKDSDFDELRALARNVKHLDLLD